jgi:peptidoglycan/LPS O-acetylase OafA/YrhL
LSGQQKIHFSGLNSLRFFAAYLVLLHHGETVRAKNGLFNLGHYSLFRNGSLAVSFFFVLSGFLITYLLLVEREKTGDIHLRNFYLRRVYRIFPLYYLLVFIGLIAIPGFLKIIQYPYVLPYDILTAGALFLFFLSFVVNPLYGSHLLEPLWSIGVEEYFYLIWAPLFKFFGGKKRDFKKKSLISYPLSIIAFVIGIKTLMMLFFYFYTTDNQAFNVLKEVLLSLKFELMAIGGVGAYWVFNNKKKDKNGVGDWDIWFFKPIVQIVLIALLAVRLFLYNYMLENPNLLFEVLFQTPVLSVFTEGVLFLWLILNVSLNPKAFFRLKNPFLEKLGEISYGIYMYQMLILFAVILFFKKMMMGMSNFTQTMFFYIITTAGVLSISWLSKKYFEDYFLKFKKSMVR